MTTEAPAPPRRKRKRRKKPPGPRISTGIALPSFATPPDVSVGVTATGLRREVLNRKRTVGALTAAEASKLFPKGGEAFTTWCARDKGLGPAERRTEAEWADLLAEFAARPIHGHRRA